MLNAEPCDRIKLDIKNMNLIKQRKTYSGIMLFIFLFVIFFSTQIKKADAVVGFVGGMTVGGEIETMYTCTCGYTAWLAAMYIYIQGKPYTMSGTYVFSETMTDIFSSWIVKPLSSMVGTYIPGVQLCYMQVGYVCTVLPSRGFITKIGTGLAVQ